MEREISTAIPGAAHTPGTTSIASTAATTGSVVKSSTIPKSTIAMNAIENDDDDDDNNNINTKTKYSDEEINQQLENFARAYQEWYPGMLASLANKLENKDATKTNQDYDYLKIQHPALRNLLKEICRTGIIRFRWPLIGPLLSAQLYRCVTLFRAKYPDPPFFESTGNSFEDHVLRLQVALQSFEGAPFTLQRLCELIVDPRQHYSNLNKLLFGLERVLSVSSVLPLSLKDEEDRLKNEYSYVLEKVPEIRRERTTLIRIVYPDGSEKNASEQDRKIVNSSSVVSNNVSSSSSSSGDPHSLKTWKQEEDGDVIMHS